MKIVIDSAIPFLEEVFEPWAEVVRLAGREICPKTVCTADALIIRTRTRCDAALLAGSSVRYIATATIGFDHIDLDYCRQQGIEVVTAAGCNARGVLQWFAAVMVYLHRDQGLRLGSTIGVVGVGHIGSLVCQYARAWGFRVIGCDPPRRAREGGDFVTLEELAAQSDLITFHTPLDDTTRHMASAALLQLLPPQAIVVNASRGEVVDTQALLESHHRYVLDVWEGEPELDAKLVAGALLATPHIAGYSAQGKANASSMVVQALARHFGLPLLGWYPPQITPCPPRSISWTEVCDTIDPLYDIQAESQRFKDHPADFEQFRNSYDYRNEYF